MNQHILGGDRYEVEDRVIVVMNGATVEVRASTDGTCMIVSIDGKVTMEPRAAAIWLVVKGTT